MNNYKTMHVQVLELTLIRLGIITAVFQKLWHLWLSSSAGASAFASLEGHCNLSTFEVDPV